MEYDGSFVDLSDEGLENFEPLTVAPAGEYRVKIVNWKTDEDGGVVMKDKNEFPYMLAYMEVADGAEAETTKTFSHFLRLPHSEMTPKEVRQCKGELRVFMESFGIDYRQRIDFEDTIGATADVVLKIKDDPEYGEQNSIKRFVTGH